ncbi:MAG: hypothetical protein PHU85_10125 [Phycisphaerae bacterium]|nr:hypothetical protein [Phycisphaerae bacterium]
MHVTRWMSLAMLAVAFGLWVLAGVARGQHHDAPVHSPHHMVATTQPAAGAGHDAHHANATVAAHLAEAGKALDALDKAVAAGDKDAAAARIKEIREHLRQADAFALGFGNTKCPIMGGAFDPAAIAADATREWKGQKVGFCCGGCPEAWDKLTDAEKQAKIDAAK